MIKLIQRLFPQVAKRARQGKVAGLTLVLIAALTTNIYAQGSGTPSQLRIKIDANGYLVLSAAAQTNPVTTSVFGNARLKTDASGNLLVVLTGGSGAPSNGPYITFTSNGSLTNAQNIGSLATGLLLNTVSAGSATLSRYAGATCTNQFFRILDNSGAVTCATVSLTADVTGILPSANGGTANAFFTVNGPTTSAKTFTFPNASTTVLTTNAAVTPAQGGTGLNNTATSGRYLKGDGTNFGTSNGSASGTGSCTNQAITALNSDAAPTCTTLTSAYVNNTIALTGTDINTSNQVTATHLAAALPINQGGTNATTASITSFNNITGLSAAGTTGTTTTNLVFSTSPTLVTPILGTPQSVNLSNATALPVGAISGLGTGVATFLATPSSANLASAITDETGSGALVFATSPTFTTPVLGTPTSGTLTNATGLPEGGLSLTNITTNNVSTSRHGFTPILPNDATKYLDGTGAYTAPAGASRAFTHGQPSNPSGVSSGTLAMQGMGSTCALTPTVTGKVIISFSGTYDNQTVADGIQTRIYYGTGTAPTNGSAVTGTLASQTSVTAIGNQTLFNITTGATGLTVSTAYWFDMALSFNVGGTAEIKTIDCVIAEQ